MQFSVSAKKLQDAKAYMEELQQKLEVKEARVMIPLAFADYWCSCLQLEDVQLKRKKVQEKDKAGIFPLAGRAKSLNASCAVTRAACGPLVCPCSSRRDKLCRASELRSGG